MLTLNEHATVRLTEAPSVLDCRHPCRHVRHWHMRSRLKGLRWRRILTCTSRRDVSHSGSVTSCDYCIIDHSLKLKIENKKTIASVSFEALEVAFLVTVCWSQCDD
ncbi:hypothetical protein FOZ63_033818 [Perkinsus olseni]|uniref:Uncharacterized protein n=1 Tax=Perkinsus olseni TaxID=32597 RepID=A0A7J6UIY2_PEROL|nr:hypothetical protein FOZ63_033818 [Perkinsus olseni]